MDEWNEGSTEVAGDDEESSCAAKALDKEGQAGRRTRDESHTSTQFGSRTAGDRIVL